MPNCVRLDDKMSMEINPVGFHGVFNRKEVLKFQVQ